MQKETQTLPGDIALHLFSHSPAAASHLLRQMARQIQREAVTRALLALAQRGIVQKDAHRLIIVKPEALQKRVEV